MKDRFVRGMIGGIIAGIPIMVLNLVIYKLGITTLRFLDFTVVFIFGQRTTGFREVFFAGIVTLGFYGGLGILYAYLITWLRSNYYWLKGFVYGAGTWFVVYATTTLYQVQNLITIPFKTAVSNFVLACLWGLILGVVYHWMTLRWGHRATEAVQRPAKISKYKIVPQPSRKVKKK